MARWEPDAHGRLQRAALDLFVEGGFEQTTVADIAHRAGVTERTFYRHFVDKREVLFSGQDELRDVVVGAVVDAPLAAVPLELMTVALDAVATLFPSERRDFARRRQVAIEADTSLRERELLKLADLSSALAAAFVERGLAQPLAGLLAESTIATFKVAFIRWLADAGDRGFAAIQREVLDTLVAVTTDR